MNHSDKKTSKEISEKEKKPEQLIEKLGQQHEKDSNMFECYHPTTDELDEDNPPDDD